ncbi:NACHT nucleoside triphosphatase [Penicillium macrosclerotiorum]|uniref:NACHT nucleoside triphosphatase n=1 Tax=Penicillium macrosclerotiorum TaxID=303699 RepID=UPI0025488E65|nr:NACHT nucleoside triphosphatase [Penicillium macrosclerotiorum]KAJ5675372.1 NACHT nucleoside triphosphatase [Penicillium macrosclerotiorum]
MSVCESRHNSFPDVTLQRRPYPGISLRLQKIRKKVGEGADGMQEIVDNLARCRHEAAIEAALASLPVNLNETYDRIMKGILTELQNDAIRLLQFAVHSKRPLTLAEAKEVIATNTEVGRLQYQAWIILRQ